MAVRLFVCGSVTELLALSFHIFSPSLIFSFLFFSFPISFIALDKTVSHTPIPTFPVSFSPLCVRDAFPFSFLFFPFQFSTRRTGWVS